ncbi:MAG TPA: hypothetical protein PKW66_05135, partial [Polyangiaceae bacterium]|nr:hypothetical protein [Polyangiaceae bacterium]
SLVFALSVAALLVGGFLLFHRSQRQRVAHQPLAAVPADAQFILTANMARLRSSPYRNLLRDASMSPLTAGAQESCGKNLEERIETLVVWKPAEPGSTMGIAAYAPVSAQSVWECAKGTMDSRGAQATFSHVEGFQIITDETLGPGSAQIAVRDPGLLVVARPGTRARMLDAFAGRCPSAFDQGTHARLRKELPKGDVVLTLTVNPAFRQRVADWVDEPSALDHVGEIGLSAILQPTTELQVVVVCESDHVCQSLEQRLQAIRTRARRSMLLRSMGVAGWLDATTLRQGNQRLHLHASLSAEQVLDLWQRLSTDPQEPPPSFVPALRSSSDETLRPPSSSPP